MTMKLRKNDLLEIQKGGKVAILAKLVEFKAERAKLAGLKMKNELKNPRAFGATRTAIAKLKTIRAELKEIK